MYNKQNIIFFNTLQKNVYNTLIYFFNKKKTNNKIGLQMIYSSFLYTLLFSVVLLNGFKVKEEVSFKNLLIPSVNAS